VKWQIFNYRLHPLANVYEMPKWWSMLLGFAITTVNIIRIFNLKMCDGIKTLGYAKADLSSF
jgi:hypothetical protein